MRKNSRKAVSLAAVLLSVAITATACSEDKATPPPAIAWTKVDLPAEPVVLTGQGTDLLIGLRDRGAKVVPRLLLQKQDGGRQEIKVEPKSPYAFEATWQSIAYDGRRLLALGGASGGAHSNTRWTVWTGSTTTLTEHPQEFNTFGGQTAGALYSALITPAGEALAGSWGGLAGLDAAVWLPQGDKWNRQDSTGTALRSTPALLVGPSFGTTSGPQLVLVGSQVRLAPNVVQQEAAVWRSTTVNQGWSGIALPEPGNRSQANTVSCTADLCTISGYVDGKLAIWQLPSTPANGSSADGGSQGKRLKNVPGITVGDKDKVPPPVVHNGRVYQVVAEGNKVKMVSGHDDSWTVQDSTGPEGTGGPEGAVKDAALVGKTLYLLAGPADGPASLWKTTLG